MVGVVAVVVAVVAAVGVPRFPLLQLPRCPTFLIPRPTWTVVVVRVVLRVAGLVLIAFLRPKQHPTCSVVICFARSCGAKKR